MIGGQRKLEDFKIGDRVVADRTILLGGGWEVPLGQWGMVKHFEVGRQHPIVVRFDGGLGDITVGPEEIKQGGELV